MTRNSAQRGLTLVELLVGLATGLVVLLVVSQVMQSFEGQKRTSTGGNDSQTNGAVALYLLEQEIRMAGYGLFGPEGAYCRNGINIYKDGGVVKNAEPFAPARIIDGTDGADTVVLMRSDGVADTLPLSIVKGMPQPSSVVTVGSDGGLQEGDLVVLGEAQRQQGLHGDATLAAPQEYRQRGEPDSQHLGAGLPTTPRTRFRSRMRLETSRSATVTVLPFGRRFSVRCDHLVESDPVDVADDAVTCANSTPMVAQVVDLQAEYGVVDQRRADLAGRDRRMGGAGRRRVLQIRAIRVGVVTRHPQFEKTAVPAPPVPAWMGDATTDLIAANANYRHRVFETVIPLRNVIWAP